MYVYVKTEAILQKNSGVKGLNHESINCKSFIKTSWFLHTVCQTPWWKQIKCSGNVSLSSWCLKQKHVFNEWISWVTEFKVYLVVVVQFFFWFKFFNYMSLLLVSNSLSYTSILRNKRKYNLNQEYIWTTIFIHAIVVFRRWCSGTSKGVH